MGLDSRLQLATMLARQFIGLDEQHRQADEQDLRCVPGDYGSAEVRIDMRAMVHGITRSIWIHTAALAKQVEDKVRAAMSEASIEAEVEREVAQHLSRIRGEISDRVRRQIDQRVEQAIDERLGSAPKLLAKKITDKMWEAFHGAGVKLGRGNIYGYRKGARSKKR